MERAFRSTTEKEKTSRFNLIHQKLVTNMIQARLDCDKTLLYQRCTDREETFQHILACSNTNASDTYKKQLNPSKNHFENVILRRLYPQLL